VYCPPPHYDEDAENYVDFLIKCVTAYTHKSRRNLQSRPCRQHKSVTYDVELWLLPKCCITSLLNFVLMYGYSQLVDFLTHETNLLDVILTDDDNIVTSVKPCPPVGYSDHIAVEFTMTMHAGYSAFHRPSKALNY